jgi:hypothetical protein
MARKECVLLRLVLFVKVLIIYRQEHFASLQQDGLAVEVRLGLLDRSVG